ncbi:helix-turn-helix domain-containing protein [Anaerovorax odorimutans]|uniref:helix-turn-helix domain-containing protein n=1 Tax=Anaerovorax odorimutans TaxID=109327 RepID=UPI0004245D12|nr:helix-turn-helix transcriptional regulator [Anaerovorax odorimutans]
MTNEEIGNRIKYARDLRKATLDDVAKKVGIAKSTVQRYESGKIEKIKLPVLESIANALSVNPAWLVGKSEETELSLSNQSIRLSANEKELLHTYNRCSSTGKERILNYSKKVLDIEKEEKRVDYLQPIAAHNDDTSDEQIELMKQDLEDL